MYVVYIAHAFGQRYELPIPLGLFVFGGAGVVLLSFLFIVNRPVTMKPVAVEAVADKSSDKPPSVWLPIITLLSLALFIAAGLFGSQIAAENIVPTIFWLIIWIAVPLSCGIIGDWTKPVNPYAVIAKLADSSRLRRMLLVRAEPLPWPAWLSWWPSVLLFFIIACGELIFNQVATLPAVTAAALLGYFLFSAFSGLVFGQPWLQKGEVFSVLFVTWGRLGYWRFGAPGKRRLAGGLSLPFNATISRTAIIVLLLGSVAFDGLLSTPLWNRFLHYVPGRAGNGSLMYFILITLIFASLTAGMWLVFRLFASLVRRAGKLRNSTTAVLSGLLPSLLPISFGYLLAHNIEYLMVNSQLLAPLIGNPIGKKSWPLRLPYPFNDSFDPHANLLPSAFYWYFSVAVIIIVHIIAVIIAHQYLGTAVRNKHVARRSEYPWIVAMVAYTMLSLWLLAQPLVKEKTTTYQSPPEHVAAAYHRITLEGKP